MSEPRRIQLSRAKGWRKPEGAVVVSRPSGWGNPFRIGDLFRFTSADGLVIVGGVGSHDQAVDLFRAFLRTRSDLRDKIRAELAGRDLCCWCKPEQACHGDLLLLVAAGEEP
jgi:hypothetical protein